MNRREVKRAPVLRFKGFTNDWEQRKLGEIVQRINRKNVNLTSTLPLTISAQYGLIDQRNFFDKQIASEKLEKYILLKKGEFAYNKSYSRNYPFGAIKRLNNYKFGALSTLYIAFKPVTIDTEYLEQYFDSTKWYKEIYKRATEGARNHGLLNISSQDFFYSLLTIPLGTLEQKKIAKLLKTISSLLDLQQRKLEQIKLLKKAMLQKILAETDNPYPKLRFFGFSNTWKKYTVNSLFKISRGYVLSTTLTEANKSAHNPYPVYSSQTKNNGLMGYYNKYLYENAITWTTDGANAGTVNYRSGKFYCTNVCGVILSDKVDANQLIAEELNTVSKRYVSYVGNPKLMNNVMANIKIIIPDQYKERQQISQLFSRQDIFKDVYQRKQNVLKILKQFLLQNMFI